MTEENGSFGQRAFARWYPRLMDRSERAGQADIRRSQLRRARGTTLEIGAGNGFSVRHYPPSVDKLVMIEPNPHLRRQLLELKTHPGTEVSAVDGDAHQLDFPSNTFDTVTASLLFCSLPDPVRAMNEVHRVLKPGGRFLFHEHVRGRGARGVLQDALTPLQRRIADGCHANRDFESLVRSFDFEIRDIQHMRMPKAIPTIVPLVVGEANKPA